MLQLKYLQPRDAYGVEIMRGTPWECQGFLPRKKGRRRKALEELSGERRTLVFYESPARISATLADIEEVLGDRKVALARELTKKLEEILRGAVSAVREKIEPGPVKGSKKLLRPGEPPAHVPCRSPAAAREEQGQGVSAGARPGHLGPELLGEAVVARKALSSRVAGPRRAHHAGHSAKGELHSLVHG